jgi:glycosyltransferase involved in cell wall biosynthesis
VTASVVVGVPTYNGAATVEESLGSLLDQHGPDLAVVVVDDCSVDGTPDIVDQLAAADPRVTLVRNPRRLGMVANWNEVLAHSRRVAPEARYFAWASDHDHWHPGWLRTLVSALDAEPAAVLAYPLVSRVLPDGSVVGGWRFDTAHDPSPTRRLRSTVRDGVAGDMIYGLFRVAALDDVGGYQPVVYPDRLLLARLALRGRFLQVPEVLWTRRVGLPSTAERQRTTLFVDRPPVHTRLPWWVQHPALVGEDAVVRLAYARSAGGVALRKPRAVVGRLLRTLGLRGPGDG